MAEKHEYHWERAGWGWMHYVRTLDGEIVGKVADGYGQYNAYARGVVKEFTTREAAQKCVERVINGD